MRTDVLSLRCFPAAKCYNSNYSEKWAPYPHSFLETAVVTEITEGVLSRLGLKVADGWHRQHLPSRSIMAHLSTEGTKSRILTPPLLPTPNPGLSQTDQDGCQVHLAEDQPNWFTGLSTEIWGEKKQHAAWIKLDATQGTPGMTSYVTKQTMGEEELSNS